MALLVALIIGHIFAADPATASTKAPAAIGLGRYSAEVLRICKIESRPCSAVSIHTKHAKRKPGSAFMRKLDVDGCGLDDLDPAEWGIRGPHGHAAAYAAPLLGRCVHPRAIDVPWLSAAVAAMRLDRLRRRGLTSPPERALAWRLGVRGSAAARAALKGSQGPPAKLDTDQLLVIDPLDRGSVR